MKPGDLVVRDGKSIWIECDPWDSDDPQLNMIDSMQIWGDCPIGIVLDTRVNDRGDPWVRIVTASGLCGWTYTEYLNLVEL